MYQFTCYELFLTGEHLRVAAWFGRTGLRSREGRMMRELPLVGDEFAGYRMRAVSSQPITLHW